MEDSHQREIEDGGLLLSFSHLMFALRLKYIHIVSSWDDGNGVSGQVT